MPSDAAIRAQSKAAYSQWCEQWREHAKYHSRYAQKDMLEFQNSGIGKAVLAVANGYSFEENIETIKKHKDKIDIICVDKSLKHLLDNGIKPKYCVVCDANVDYETYMEPYKDQLEETTLFTNVCANTKWTSNGNWKDINFFVNMDILKSEREFSELSGCNNIIAAGTNVSNALLILLTQCNNSGRNNFFGYDKILLTGYDYCWSDISYYAFDKTAGDKEKYMKTTYCYDMAQNLCFTSSNLLFSAKWADKYIKTFRLQVVQCTKRSILSGMKQGDLEEQMQYEYKTEDSNKVKSLLQYRKGLAQKMIEMDQAMFNIGRDHYKQVVRTT